MEKRTGMNLVEVAAPGLGEGLVVWQRRNGSFPAPIRRDAWLAAGGLPSTLALQTEN
jgi:hypothetical protein